MKFETLEEFLVYFVQNSIDITTVDFNFTVVDPENPEVTPDAIQEPTNDEPVPDDGVSKTRVVEQFITLQLASGEQQYKLDSDGYLLVDGFEHVPNTCGAGWIQVEGTRIYTSMCDEDGQCSIILPTSNGNADKVLVKKKV